MLWRNCKEKLKLYQFKFLRSITKLSLTNGIFPSQTYQGFMYYLFFYIFLSVIKYWHCSYSIVFQKLSVTNIIPSM